jgi:hypothetical protein
MCDRYELVKSPAKEITDANSQSEINQSQHTQILADLRPSTGANPKCAIFSVKHSRNLFYRQITTHVCYGISEPDLETLVSPKFLRA